MKNIYHPPTFTMVSNDLTLKGQYLKNTHSTNASVSSPFPYTTATLRSIVGHWYLLYCIHHTRLLEMKLSLCTYHMTVGRTMT